MKDDNKIAFATEIEAREELERIVNTNYNPCVARNKKPCRSYQNSKNLLWYLTSKPLIY
jgi:hypothetical protein